MTTKEDLVKFFRSVGSLPMISHSEYEAKLRDFVESIKEGIPEINGRVRRTDQPLVRWNVDLWPQYRPDQRALMITVSQQGDRVLVHGEQQHSFHSPAELWTYLIDFSKNPAFRASLLELKQMNHEPAPGLLRTVSQTEPNPDDVSVEVAPDTIRSIHDRTASTYSVKLVSPPQLGVFSPATQYRYLTVAGLVVEVDQVTRQDETLIIVGQVPAE